MKILHTVKSYSPLSGGMHEAVKQISKNLDRRGHIVTIASGKIPEEFPTSPENMKVFQFDFRENGEDKRYQDYLINSDFDIITNFAALQPMTDLALPVLDKIAAKKVFVPTGFNALFSKTHTEYFENMKKWIRQYDLNIFLSNNYQDINFARKNSVPEEKIVVIPNGASREEFFEKNVLDIRKKMNIKDDFLILHVGSFTGVKGHNEAIEIFSKAIIKNSTLLLVGNGDNKCSKRVKDISKKLNGSLSFLKQNKRIIIPNFTREETVSSYKEADLFLFPSNTECSPIVLFEAMAAGLPFLSTDVGNVKEIVDWSNAGMLLPTKHNAILGENLFAKIKKLTKRSLIKIGLNFWNPDIQYSKAGINDSVKILEKIYSDPQKRKELGNNGRNSWLENFTWEKISEKYETEYKKLLAK